MSEDLQAEVACLLLDEVHDRLWLTNRIKLS